MNDDLRSALSDIAGGAAAATSRRSPGLHPAALLAEARRRRRRFQVQVVGTGLAASVVLGTGGLAVADAFREEEPPVEVDLTAPYFSRELPACGTSQADLEDERDPMWSAEAALPGSVPADDPLVDATVRLRPGPEYAEVSGTWRGHAVLLVRDGEVVAYGDRQTADGDTSDVVDAAEFTTGSEAPTAEASFRLVPCDGEALSGGRYEAYAAVEVRPEAARTTAGEEPVFDADYGWLLVGPETMTLEASEWSAVDASSLPDEVPLVEGRVVVAEQHADGDAWRATVEVAPEAGTGEEAYPAVETLLLDAGFVLAGEAEATPGTTTATFTGGGYEVRVQVDLSTGAYATYEIARTGDAGPLLPRTVLPEGDASLPYGACGSLVASAPTLPWTGEVVTTTTPQATTARPGGRLWVESSTGDVGGTTITVVPETGPTFVVVRDGVVVGVSGLFADEGPLRISSSYPGFWDAGAVGAIDLVVCDPGTEGRTTPGAPLPPGEYRVQAVMPVTWIGVEHGDAVEGADVYDVEAVQDHPTAQRGTARSTAFTLLVEGEPAGATPAGEDARDVGFPGEVDLSAPCGAPAPEVSQGMFTLERDAQSAALNGRVLDTRVTLRYQGPGRVELFPGNYVEYVLVRDGVVVGTGDDPGSDGGTLRMRHGAGLVREAGTPLGACPDPWEQPLAAGTYQVYPTLYVSVSHVTLTDGTVVAPEPAGGDEWSSTEVVGEPFELVVE